MLLQQVLQLPEKVWTPDTDPVMATLTVAGQYSTDQYGFKQPIQLKDDSGVSSEVVVQSKYEKGLMAQNMVGTRGRWRLKWYQGGQKQVIVGYCLDKMQQSPAPPLQQAAPQPLQQPMSAPNVPKPRDYDAENRGKIRHGLVCAYISAGVDPTVETVNYWTEYIMTGVAPLPPAKQQAEELLGQPNQQWEH